MAWKLFYELTQGKENILKSLALATYDTTMDNHFYTDNIFMYSFVQARYMDQ